MLKPRLRTFGISFLLATAFACAFAGVLSSPLQAQSVTSLPSRRAEAASRAEEEAQRKVSLSADKIIQILRNEPGLLLEVKKMLVKKAYEQGRILDAADLSDEALFHLLWEDDNIRVLATQEIEDRYYVRAKPTREELERQMILGEERGISRTSAPNVPSGQAARNQEPPGTNCLPAPELPEPLASR